MIVEAGIKVRREVIGRAAIELAQAKCDKVDGRGMGLRWVKAPPGGQLPPPGEIVRKEAAVDAFDRQRFAVAQGGKFPFLRAPGKRAAVLLEKVEQQVEQVAGHIHDRGHSSDASQNRPDTRERLKNDAGP